ncbi:hypothetical protein GBK02_06025 [Dechloromonas sp. TW-R-39-2]|uniref:L,D-transpeptidase family protein n=1 Tax=Dechloromonas sp. TW-R-39-2 TaxID=2654218 RepID=UPI00193E5FFB|nr:hypothetical protein [Dechloromonas sp. TW-R-39-2]QRM18979.1 hypothetical protein GBK02_06025 [Dechloromonas sp. TW-R-39-2]
MIPIPADCRQILLCLAPTWDAQDGRLQCFERLPGGAWKPEGEALPVTLGRNGLAWGRGRHPAMSGLAKQEGDGRAPAGVFSISAVFGYAPAACVNGLPYLSAHPGLRCVDDPASAHYNCLVDQASCAVDWTSSEAMLRSDARYELGAVVAHNADAPKAGCGSCIFLHVWEAPGVPTAGCTAMALADMRRIVAWLEGAAAPVLLQLPSQAYASLRADWALPLWGGPELVGLQP